MWSKLYENNFDKLLSSLACCQGYIYITESDQLYSSANDSIPLDNFFIRRLPYSGTEYCLSLSSLYHSMCGVGEPEAMIWIHTLLQLGPQAKPLPVFLCYTRFFCVEKLGVVDWVRGIFLFLLSPNILVTGTEKCAWRLILISVLFQPNFVLLQFLGNLCKPALYFVSIRLSLKVEEYRHPAISNTAELIYLSVLQV